MIISVPGRVNLIGEHIDYHDLPVLPMAIQRRVTIDFEPRGDRRLFAESRGYPQREFGMDEAEPFEAGDWGNYLKAAVQLITPRWPLHRGLNAKIHSDLPLAAGLSSSSALMTATTLALLEVNAIRPTTAELMELLPDGEQYVGTRGGGMDHAAVLASRAGCALLLGFAPFKFEPIPIPTGWTFLIAHSLTIARKSGAAKAEYNSRRVAGRAALVKLGLGSYKEALAGFGSLDSGKLGPEERDAFLHVTSEAKRVAEAVNALRNNQIEEFGRLLSESHGSLRDQLRVSHPALDELVECALSAGALGARLTGAGFGGCAIVLCKAECADDLRTRLVEGFYSRHPDFISADHLMVAEASAGALSE